MNFAVLVSLFIPSLALANLDEKYLKACQSNPILEISDGLCRCRLDQSPVEPDRDSQLGLCRRLNRYKAVCDDPAYAHLGLEFIYGRCFCVHSRSYVTPRVYPWVEGALNSEIVSPSQKVLMEECEWAKSLAVKYERYTGAITVYADLPVTHTKSGHSIYPIRKLTPNSPWNRKEDGIVSQGDPRWALSKLGLRLALFFGYAFVDQPDNQTIYVPGAEHLNWSIERLNRLIQEKHSGSGAPYWTKGEIPFRFYSVKGELPKTEYVQNIAKGKIPLAEVPIKGDQQISLHDINHHTFSWIVLPVPFFEFVQGFARDLIQFDAFIKSHALAKNRHFYIRMVDEIFYHFTRFTDVFSGNIAVDFSGNKPDSAMLLLDGFKELFHTQTKPLRAYTREALFFRITEPYFSESPEQLILHRVISDFFALRAKEDPGFTQPVQLMGAIEVQAVLPQTLLEHRRKFLDEMAGLQD